MRYKSGSCELSVWTSETPVKNNNIHTTSPPKALHSVHTHKHKEPHLSIHHGINQSFQQDVATHTTHLTSIIYCHAFCVYVCVCAQPHEGLFVCACASIVVRLYLYVRVYVSMCFVCVCAFRSECVTRTRRMCTREHNVRQKDKRKERQRRGEAFKLQKKQRKVEKNMRQ